jgi:hypothetical protein
LVFAVVPLEGRSSLLLSGVLYEVVDGRGRAGLSAARARPIWRRRPEVARDRSFFLWGVPLSHHAMWNCILAGLPKRLARCARGRRSSSAAHGSTLSMASSVVFCVGGGGVCVAVGENRAGLGAGRRIGPEGSLLLASLCLLLLVNHA